MRTIRNYQALIPLRFRQLTDKESQQKSQWFVYMVLCSDNTIYTGCTNNLENRILIHNRGKGAKYTKMRRPVKLIWSEKHDSRSRAQSRESKIKQLSRYRKKELVASSAYHNVKSFLTTDIQVSRFIRKTF